MLVINFIPNIEEFRTKSRALTLFLECISKTFENQNPVSMKRKSTFAAIGGYQPFLFCIGMYMVALFFSIFVCSAIFYAVNPRKVNMAGDQKNNSQKTAMVTSSPQVLLTVAASK
jgi:hypothetical protein